MIVDIRYHVVSLVAVFLALGLGIVVGANLGRNVNLGFEKQIQNLETTYEKIREDQRVLQATIDAKDYELEVANQFQKAIVPNLIGNKLLGKRVAILRTNTSVDFRYPKQLVDLLRQAGAEVTSITSFSKAMNLSDPQFKNELIQAFDLHEADDAKLFPAIYNKIVDIIVKGQGSSQLVYLQNKDMVQLWGDYNRGYADTLIFWGGGMIFENNFQKDIDVPLLDAARNQGITFIGVEPSFAVDSYMKLYQSKCPNTIDNIDTPPGQVTLVYLLASGKKGHYGIKDTARALIPEIRLNY
ncbi:copper transport outer membrane protein MctB [Hydrogenispora ethanolica]|uniref:Copper transport outer membrane protein MctB n=1 Tax=Hydrogenispora ethanolica TaxID=1082276 RepID=A0A4R1QVG8_HYDET|nr:copper transporter [Hydrogenispora ethanolica]TCL57121.1 copper transport outer membrane protein MctB [Hydrogenispora ethanolica]